GTGHLADHVGHGDDYQADHRSQARATTVETVTDEIRHGELAELAQVGCQQHRQQHVAAGPAHEEGGVGITTGGNQARHGNEGCSRHPVSGCRHTVGDRMHTTASDVELFGGAGTRPDGDADVEREGRAYEQHVDYELAHDRLLLDAKFFIKFVQSPRVVKNEPDKEEDEIGRASCRERCTICIDGAS